VSAGAPPDRWTPLESLKDNIEAFTIALVMALVIKHFCVEAFKIPTSSMMPTLQGDTDSGDGDRILVDKWAYLFSEPARWDVLVFRYPLNRSKHFIKRLAGLGGEWLKIHEGDVWTRRDPKERWRIATKRRRVREELYVPVYPPTAVRRGDESRRLSQLWDPGEAWTLDEAGAFRFRGGDAAPLVLRKGIGSRTEATSLGLGGEGQSMGDARFRLRVRPVEAATVTLSWQREDGESTVLTLSQEGVPDVSTLVVRRGETEWSRPFAARLVPGRPTAVELECLDGEVYVHLDGEEVLHLDVERELVDRAVFSGSTQRFQVTARGGAVEIDDVRIDRDIYYTSEGMNLLDDGEGLKVPEGHYFMLGDNSPASSDSRKWTYRCVKLKDGREVCWDTSQGTYPDSLPDGRRTVTDLDGIDRAWWPADEDDTLPSPSARHNAPFVARRLVVGRAFFIFWPLLPDFPGRLRFIR
jgi:signal peptidase I